MADDPKKRGLADRSRVNTLEDYEVRYWTEIRRVRREIETDRREGRTNGGGREARTWEVGTGDRLEWPESDRKPWFLPTERAASARAGRGWPSSENRSAEGGSFSSGQLGLFCRSGAQDPSGVLQS